MEWIGTTNEAASRKTDRFILTEKWIAPRLYRAFICCKMYEGMGYPTFLSYISSRSPWKRPLQRPTLICHMIPLYIRPVACRLAYYSPCLQWLASVILLIPATTFKSGICGREIKHSFDIALIAITSFPASMRGGGRLTIVSMLFCIIFI